MPRGPVFMLDTMWAGAGGPPNPKLLAREAYMEMIATAQKLGTQYQIPREEIDRFALRSHQRAAIARDSGRFAKEIVAVQVPGARKQSARVVEHDEGIRADTSLGSLAPLPAQPGTEVMTAGNSSQLSDGASAIVLASAKRAHEFGVNPLVRVIASATAAFDPTIMGIAPAFAMPKAIERAQIRRLGHAGRADVGARARRAPPPLRVPRDLRRLGTGRCRGTRAHLMIGRGGSA